MFRFDHVAVYVTDLEKSAEFYKKLFDLISIPNPFPEGKSWFDLGLGIQLHLIENEGGTQFIPERNHLCFAVRSLEDFINLLKNRNVTWSDFDGNEFTVRNRPDGIRQIYFQDPDGYWIEVNDAG